MSEQWGQQPQDQPDQGQTQAQYPQQQYRSAPPLGGGFGGGPGYGLPGQPYGPPRNSKLAITSLILGIVSLPLMVIAVIGPVVAFVGLVLGVIGIAGASRKNLKRGVGIAGIVLSLIGLIGGGLVTTVELHALNACKSIDSKTDPTAYNDCVRHNLKF